MGQLESSGAYPLEFDFALGVMPGLVFSKAFTQQM
jgi:hypothetical protein